MVFELQQNTNNLYLYIRDFVDPDTGRLAGGVVQRHVDDVTVVGIVLRRSDDVRQLRPVQPARRHLGRGFRCRRPGE